MASKDKELILENLKEVSMENSNYTKEYEKVQYETLKYANEKFDKNVLFIASGALTLTLGFIKQITPSSTLIRKDLMLVGWVMFAGTIFIALFSSFVAILANRWAIRQGGVMEDMKYERISKWWNYTIRTMYVLMILFLLVGMISVIKFEYINL